LDTIGPAAPILAAPANNSYTANQSVRFNWTIVEPGDEWQLMLSYYEDFSSYSLHDTPNDYLDFPSLSEETIYWKVRGKDALDNYGPWSETGIFTIDITSPTVPNPISPSNESISGEALITFEWEPLVDTIAWYRIHVSRFADFSVIYYSPYVEYSDNNFTSSGLFSEGTFYWRIRAVDMAWNVGNWSETWMFTLDLTGPSSPYLSSPDDGEILNDNTPAFVWIAVSDAVEYWLMIDNYADWMYPEVNITTVDTFFTFLSPLPDDQYSWRVKAKDEYGNWGDWSLVRIFTINTSPIPEYGFAIPLLIIVPSVVIIALVIVKKDRVIK
jgi:hypothetical protein